MSPPTVKPCQECRVEASQQRLVNAPNVVLHWCTHANVASFYVFEYLSVVREEHWPCRSVEVFSVINAMIEKKLSAQGVEFEPYAPPARPGRLLTVGEMAEDAARTHDRYGEKPPSPFRRVP
jgi:hypothetical protein